MAVRMTTGPANDQALVEQLMSRDPAALAAVYDGYGRAVFALALRILGDPAGAEDVVHDVFLKLWGQPEQYRVERGSLRAWLLSVAHNRAIDLLRRRRAATTQLVTENGAADSRRELPIRDSELDPSEQTALADEAARVRWALAQIPALQRQAIEMAFFEGKTHVEISEELGEPLGTAKTRIRLGMRKLRALLEGKEAVS